MIADNVSEGMVYETSYNARIVHNTFRRNGLAAGAREGRFPTPALYLSESGSDPRAGELYAGTLTSPTTGSSTTGPASSRGRTPTGSLGHQRTRARGTRRWSTLAWPLKRRAATRTSSARFRYYDDCRWKTQHIRVIENVFVLRPRLVGRQCTARRQCGYNGVFSQYGTYPSWSPYRGTVIEEAITFTQDNIWPALASARGGSWHSSSATGSPGGHGVARASARTRAARGGEQTGQRAWTAARFTTERVVGSGRDYVVLDRVGRDGSNRLGRLGDPRHDATP